jgi:hypothetical protein
MPGTPARYVFLTLPTSTEPVLNLSVSGEHPARYLLNRTQLYDLNTQIADALIRGRIDDKHAFRHPDQLQLNLTSSGAG